MKSQEELVSDEQKILNQLIVDMDRAMLQLDKRLSHSKLIAKKAKDKCLPDTYGLLVKAQQDKKEVGQRMRALNLVRDELYSTRIEVEINDGSSVEREDIKIGLHTYMSGTRNFVTSWKMPVCRHYILDNSAEEFDGVVIGTYGQRYKTHYQLLLKRQIKLHFDTVKNVIHFFPTIEEEDEKIVADEFLQELLSRRAGQEFKNIVFSIQKHQGEIIQTPFRQNLIVQGCAGSGKSMIMLHRLPIVIYDNPNSLNKANLYIITPSIAYIQMAENMRIDLEIEDLEMGTLEQYYNHVIRKYRRNPEEYGKIKPFIKLSKELEKYVYSEACIDDMMRYIDYQVQKCKVDIDLAYEILSLTKNDSSITSKTKSDEVREEILCIQKVLNENDKIIRGYYQNIRSVLLELEALAKVLATRNISVLRAVDRLITTDEKVIQKAEKELETIDKEAHEIIYQNRVSAINSARDRITDNKETKEIIELDVEYFNGLRNKADKIRKVISLYDVFLADREKIDIAIQYKGIDERETFIELVENIIIEISKIEDPYWEYRVGWNAETENLKKALVYLIRSGDSYIPWGYFSELITSSEKLNYLNQNIILDTYLNIMKKLGQEKDEKGRLTALSCSPYLFLQILYNYSGAPAGGVESLITIDEAQNLAVKEFELIKKVNGNRVILNLFGDVKQHIEDSKGIDDWNELKEVANFQIQRMQENYRNARQVTDYCNKRFKLKMRAINLDGKGVHEIKDETQCFEDLISVFQKPQNPGLSCIIVKNSKEADTLINKMKAYENRIHDMTKEWKELQKGKWNLMTIEEAKGLEFETVFAMSGRMSKNEKYIAYTRALDELYIFDEQITLIENGLSILEDEDALKDKSIKPVSTIRKKREKRTTKKTVENNVKNFFEEKGLEVIDVRDKNGFLWVLGEKSEIDSIINQAIEKFSISGEYGSGKTSGFRPGWYTKTKK